MSNYSIRKLENTEFHLLIPLMKDCFGMNVNVDYFEWKFVNNPAGFVEGFIAVSEEGEIAAYYGVIPEQYYIEGKLTTVYQSCDTMTHSKHRRKGLFQKLALHCYDHLRKENRLFVIGFGGEQSTPGFLKFGWVHVFDMKIYFIPKAMYWINFSSDKKVHEIADPAQLSHLVAKANATDVIHSNKTPELFKWRISNPNYQYKLLGYGNDSNTLTSYACYYLFDNKLVLFDFYFENSRAGKALTGRLKKIASSLNLKGITAFVQEHSAFAKTVSKAGFITNPFRKGPLAHRTPFIFYAEEAVMKQYNNPGQWLINSFDHDAM